MTSGEDVGLADSHHGCTEHPRWFPRFPLAHQQRNNKGEGRGEFFPRGSDTVVNPLGKGTAGADRKWPPYGSEMSLHSCVKVGSQDFNCHTRICFRCSSAKRIRFPEKASHQVVFPNPSIPLNNPTLAGALTVLAGREGQPGGPTKGRNCVICLCSPKSLTGFPH